MARVDALEAASRAIVNLLEDAFRDSPSAPSSPPTFGVDVSIGLLDGVESSDRPRPSVDVFPHRIALNGDRSYPAGATNTRRPPRLAVDIHVLILISANEAATRLQIAGRLMRKLRDHPMLPAGLLNRDRPGAFDLDETVEVVFEDLSHEELLHTREVLGVPDHDRMLLPYVLPGIFIESDLDVEEEHDVRERLIRYGTLQGQRT